MATPISNEQVAAVRVTLDKQMKLVGEFSAKFHRQLAAICKDLGGEGVDPKKLESSIDLSQDSFQTLTALKATQETLLQQLRSLLSDDKGGGTSLDPSAKAENTFPPDTKAKSAPPPPTGPRLIKAMVKTSSSGMVQRQLGSSVLTVGKGKGAVDGFQANVHPLVQGLHTLFRNDQSNKVVSPEKLALAAFDEYFKAQSAAAESLAEGGSGTQDDDQPSTPQATLAAFKREARASRLRAQQKQKQKQPPDEKEKISELIPSQLVDHLLEDTLLLTKAFQARLAVRNYRKDALSHELDTRKSDDESKAPPSNPIASHTTFKERLINLSQGKPEERRKLHLSVFDELMKAAKGELDKQGGVQAWINKIIEKDPAKEPNSKTKLKLLQDQVFALHNLAMLCVASDTVVVAGTGAKGHGLVQVIANGEREFGFDRQNDEDNLNTLNRYKVALLDCINDACGLLDDPVTQPTPESKAAVVFERAWGVFVLGAGQPKLRQKENSNLGTQMKAEFVEFLEKDVECRDAFNLKEEQDQEKVVSEWLRFLNKPVAGGTNKASVESIFSELRQILLKTEGVQQDGVGTVKLEASDSSSSADARSTQQQDNTSEVNSRVDQWMEVNQVVLNNVLSELLEKNEILDRNLVERKRTELSDLLKNAAKEEFEKGRTQPETSDAATQRLNTFILKLGSGEGDVKKVVERYLKLSQETSDSAPTPTPKAKDPSVEELFDEAWAACKFDGAVDDLEAIKDAFVEFFDKNKGDNDAFLNATDQERIDNLREWVELLRRSLNDDRLPSSTKRQSVGDLKSFFLTKLPDILKPTDSGHKSPSNRRDDQYGSQQDPIGTRSIASKAKDPSVEELFDEAWKACQFEGVEDDLEEIRGACLEFLNADYTAQFLNMNNEQRKNVGNWLVPELLKFLREKNPGVSGYHGDLLDKIREIWRTKEPLADTSDAESTTGSGEVNRAKWELEPTAWFKGFTATWKHPKELSKNDLLAIKIVCWYKHIFPDLKTLGDTEVTQWFEFWVHGALNDTSKTFLAEKTKLTSEQKEDLTNVEKRVRFALRQDQDAPTDADLKTLIANMKGEGLSLSDSSGSVSNLGGVLFVSQVLEDAQKATQGEPTVNNEEGPRSVLDRREGNSKVGLPEIEANL